MRISDWSSDVCSSDLPCATTFLALSVRRSSGGQHEYVRQLWTRDGDSDKNANRWENGQIGTGCGADWLCASIDRRPEAGAPARRAERGRRISASRSEEHTSELQSLMRTSYAVFCLKKKTKKPE